jgi:tetratricopeptide (TPR) repeat protein
MYLLIALGETSDANKIADLLLKENISDTLLLDVARIQHINGRQKIANSIYNKVVSRNKNLCYKIYFYKLIDCVNTDTDDNFIADIKIIAEGQIEGVSFDLDVGLAYAVAYRMFFKNRNNNHDDIIFFNTQDNGYNYNGFTGKEINYVKTMLMLGNGEIFTAIGDAYYIAQNYNNAIKYYTMSLSFTRSNRSVGISPQSWAQYMLNKIQREAAPRADAEDKGPMEQK